MSYNELKSLYYGDNDVYAQEYYNRFNSEETVKLNFFIGEKQAFFLQNAEVMTIAYKIQKLDKEICKICNELPGVALNQYSKKCLIDEIVITNKIEGVHSSRKEIGDALDILETQSKDKGKQKRFIGLVNKYLKLINSEYISIKNCEDIRDIYDEIFLEEIVHEDPTNKPDGELFRKDPVSVHSETDKIIHSGLMPESKIIEAMQQALYFLGDDSIEDIFRTCIFHYLIEYIHPFYDGNGRLGRFIFSYGISQSLCSLVSLRISETIKENINLYYKAFKICNDQRNLGDLTPFLLMMLNMILKTMDELKKSLLQKLSTWEKYESVVDEICEHDDIRRLYSYLIQAALFSEKGISIKELITNMGISQYLINKTIKQIPEELIVIKKKSNFKFYSINLDKLNAIMLQKSMDSIIKSD